MDIDKDSKTTPFWKKIDLYQTVLIALSPVAVYIIKFTYDMGYGAYFGIPLQFVSFSLPSIFATGLVLLIILWVIAGYLGTYFTSTKVKPHPVRTLFRNFSVLLTFCALFFLIRESNYIAPIFVWTLTFYVAIRHIIIPSIYFRKTKGVENKYLLHIEKVKERTETYNDFAFNFAVYSVSTKIIITLLSLLFIYQYASSVASNQTKFYTYTEGNKNYVVLRQLDEKVVLADYSKQVIGNQIRLLDLTNEGVVLEYKELGKLQTSSP
ncbi:MAG: hypothetical protein JWO54_292 [Candidatus Saccharibacteria bacterium]|nr:hypothetical protein [Candidatus Saccharibacteria bacterium]